MKSFVLRWLKRCAYLLVGFVVFLGVAFVLAWAVPIWGWPTQSFRDGPPPLTPAWALECWVWEDDTNTAEFVEELLAGYREHDFPVRTILIDSPWSTRYNDFQVDEARYPNPAEFFGKLDAEGYRVVLWMTSMVCSHSKDTAIQEGGEYFQEALDQGYLAGDGLQTRWWKGEGGFIDYTNPEAMAWWHGLQQQVFDWGLDGWKLDGTATFFGRPFIGPIPLGYLSTQAGTLTTRSYMNHYYTDEYEHGLTQNPEFITMSRAIDDNIAGVHRHGFSPVAATPVAWVGDQDHTWPDSEEGIEEALRDILQSARKGYNIVGSDVGGYGGSTIPAELYIRWAQFSAFNGLFLNGGHGERRLWLRSEEELTIIRKFMWLHTELIPYIYSYVVQAHEGGEVLLRPYGEGYDFFCGENLFVAPIHEDSPTREVMLPPGGWRYFFDDGELLEGGAAFTRDYPLDEFPVFVREGAIVPMKITRDYTGIGELDWADRMAFNVYLNGGSRFEFYDTEDQAASAVEVEEVDEGVRVGIDGEPISHLFYIRTDRKPAAISSESASLAEGVAWNYDAGKKRITLMGQDGSSSYVIRF